LPLLAATGSLAAPAEEQSPLGIQSAVSQVFGNFGFPNVDGLLNTVSSFFTGSNAVYHAEYKAKDYYAERWIDGAKEFVKHDGITCEWLVEISTIE